MIAPSHSGTQALTFVGCRLSALAVINTLRMPGFALCLRLRVMASGQRMQTGTWGSDDGTGFGLVVKREATLYNFCVTWRYTYAYVSIGLHLLVLVVLFCLFVLRNVLSGLGQ